ncbi:MAG: MarR family winged helix-turn-helix transcriptional regulator [Candidatus Binataceae bacterium]
MPAPDASAIPAAAITEVCLCHHLRRSARAVSRVYDRAFQPFGIKASQFNVLAAIAALETAPVGRLATMLAMERTTLLRNLRPLQRAGYLEGSGKGPLVLTTAGRDLLSAASVAWREAQQSLTGRIGASRAGHLLQALTAIAGA